MGFDEIELHAANGYLPDQFLQDGSNKRTDSYGGSIENRSRFLLEVVEAMASVWGGDRVAVRIAPAGTWNHMHDSDPGALFTYVAEQLNRFALAYLHIVEPRVKGNTTIKPEQGPIAAEQLRKVFKGKIIAAGGFEPETAESAIETGVADAVSFGRHFVANPDLPLRIREGLALSHRMTEIPSTPSTQWATTITPSSTNWRIDKVMEETSSEMLWTLLCSAHTTSGAYTRAYPRSLP